MSIRTLVVDDEPQARKTLRIRLGEHPDFELVGESSSGTAALDAIRELGPDLVFLDIQMPDMSGFDVLRQLDEEEVPFVVFVTAYDDYALEAFEVNALAYLLKPFDDIRFNEAVDRCRRFFRGGPGARDQAALVERIRGVLETEPASGKSALTAPGRAPATHPDGRIVVKSGTRTRIVRLEEVDWIEADGNYARLHCQGGEVRHLVTRPLGELADSLEGHGFIRIHRSAIVNKDRITELRTDNHRDYTVLLESGQTLRLSRTYRNELERALGDRI